MKLLLIFLFSTFVTVYTASCRQRCNDVYDGAGGTLKHFSDGPLCKCSLPPISSIKSSSACDRHCENYHRVDCFYSPALGCITYAYIDTTEERY